MALFLRLGFSSSLYVFDKWAHTWSILPGWYSGEEYGEHHESWTGDLSISLCERGDHHREKGIADFLILNPFKCHITDPFGLFEMRKKCIFQLPYSIYSSIWSIPNFNQIKFQEKLLKFETQNASLRRPCFGEFDMEKGAKIFPACVQVYWWSPTCLCDGLDVHNRSDYGVNVVDFNKCKNLKMTLYLQINPVSHINKIFSPLSGPILYVYKI